MTNDVVSNSIFIGIKYIVIFLIPFVEPQLAGILGALAYLIVRHELKMIRMSIKSISIVIFFGWLGAWATVNIIAAHYPQLPDVWEQIISATVGFLSYDAMLALGANSKSVIGFFADMIAKIIEKAITKWNS